MIDLINELEENKILISLEENDLRLDYEGEEISAVILEKLKQHKQELISYLKKYSQLESYDNIIPIVGIENYRLSSSQFRMWLLSQSEEGSVAYNISNSFSLKGFYNTSLLERAIKSTIERHESLRTIFKENEAAEIKQWILTAEETNFKVDFQDFTSVTNKEDRIREIMKKDAHTAFDLSRPPLIRVIVFLLNTDDYILYYNMHHIISDGWSMNVLVQDILTYYSAYLEERDPILPSLNIQYKDYAEWQYTQLKKDSFKNHQQYWLQNLSGSLTTIDLPTGLARPPIKTYNGHHLQTSIAAEVTKKLRDFCDNNNGSLFTGLLSVWNILLYKYTGINDIITGTAVAGRADAELKNQIGCFINSLALRNIIDPSENFTAIYNSINEQTLAAFDHQLYPFDQLIQDVKSIRNPARNALFDTLFILQNTIENNQSEMAESTRSDLIISKGEKGALSDIDVIFIEIENNLSFNITYNTDVYELEMIENLVGHYKVLLSELLEHPLENIKKIQFLGETEKKGLVENLNATNFSYDHDKTITQLFVEQVMRYPDYVAVRFYNQQITYLELDQLSSQLANCLLNKGIKKEELIPIYVERSIEMIIGILGILKAGGVYVPVGQNFPKDRVLYILEDINARLMISDAEKNDFEDRDLIIISPPVYREFSTEQVSVNIDPSHLAYVIYTSGTTGMPKGVLLEHRNIVRLFFNEGNLFSFSEKDIWTMFHAYTFDFSVWEMYGALLFGGKLIIVPSAYARDPELFADLLISEEVTILNQTPSSFKPLQQVLLSSGKDLTLRYVIFGGEKLNPSLLKNWLVAYPDCKLINMYGITETTVHVTYKEITLDAVDLQISNIGKPIPTLGCLILDGDQNLVAPGVAGELYVYGSGVARGYLNRPDLTVERFIKLPDFGDELFYKSGDLVRLLSNGEMGYLGRIDSQVKIRGYRIELGEIEQAILAHHSISQVVIYAKEEQDNKVIIAYYVKNKPVNKKELHDSLSKRLPDYMLPAYYVELTAIPLNANGKVDTQSLPEVNEKDLIKETYQAPGTAEEVILVEVFEAVLKRNHIGIQDNFYNLGGDSIKSIQIVSRLKQQGYILRVDHIMRNPVIMDLVQHISLNTVITDQSPVVGNVDLTPIQHYFFQNKMMINHYHFNQSVLLKSEQQLKTDILQKVIYDIAGHHDALRMVYHKTDEYWEQYNHEFTPEKFIISFYDLQEEDEPRDYMAKIAGQAQSSIDLDNGPLFKILHFRLSDGDRIALIIHHLVVDGVSWRILLEDLTSLYSGYETGDQIKLPLKTNSFQEWASSLTKYAYSHNIASEISYWAEIEEQNLPQNLLSALTIAKQAKDYKNAHFVIDKVSTELLQTKVHQTYSTEINDILLTGLAMAIYDVLQVDRSILKMEGHGREEIIDDIDISRTVGWFTTIYPFLLRVNPLGTLLDNLITIKEDLKKVPNKGIGYGILKYLADKDLPDLPMYITFNYLGDFGNKAGDRATSIFDYGTEYIGETSSHENATDTLLDISGLLVNDELTIVLRYTDLVYDQELMEQLSTSYKNHILTLIAQLSSEKRTYLTPSDLTFKGLTLEELAILNAEQTVEDVYQLSPLQQGIYYHWLADTSTAMYFEQVCYRIKGADLEMETVKFAYDQLISRHGILRTFFVNDYAGLPLQVVNKSVKSKFKYINVLSETYAENTYEFAEKIKSNDRDAGFDLEDPSQMRLIVLDYGDNEYEFIWSHHHILMDGWCISTLVNEFYKFLNKDYANLTSVTPYSNYIRWLDRLERANTLKYWKKYLAGYHLVASIPTANIVNSYKKSYKAGRECLTIDQNRYQRMKTLCTELDITLNTFIQGVWGYLLSRYNHTNDVVFGAVVSGRPGELHGVEDMIGLFINTIPVRIKYTTADTPKLLLKELQSQSIASTPHHYLNLSAVQGTTELKMDLIDHILVFENYPVKDAVKLNIENTRIQQEEKIKVISVGVVEQTNYDFEIAVGITEAALNLNFIYNSNKYDADFIRSAKTHLTTLVDEFINYPDRSLNAIKYLSDREENEILTDLFIEDRAFKDNYQLLDSFGNTIESDYQVYVFDKHLHLCAKNVVGNIYVSAAGLNRVMTSNEEVKGTDVLDNPLKHGQKMFKTQAIGKFLITGQIEFLGQLSDQMNIRGHRIAAKDIECLLESLEGIRKCVVISKILDETNEQIIAYIVSDILLNANELRQQLSDKLPDFMIPAYFVKLDSLPLTASGTIDKQELPLPRLKDSDSLIEDGKSETIEEKLLISVWQEVLNNDKISVLDNFYQIGGDSIKSIQVVAKLKQRGYTLKIEHILRNAVLEDMAKYLTKGISSIDQAVVAGPVELLPIQQDFFDNNVITNKNHFNQSVLLKSVVPLDSEGIIACFNVLIKHHDALRMTYNKEANRWTQYNRDNLIEQDYFNLYDLRGKNNELAELAEVGEKLQSGFNLEKGLLIKVAHFRLAEDDRLAIIVHHLIMDGISWRILLEDFVSLYEDYKENKNLRLPLKTNSFQDWATLLKKYVLKDSFFEEIDLWRNITSQAYPALPYDKPHFAEDMKINKTMSFTLSKQVTNELISSVIGSDGLRINELLLTSMAFAFDEVFNMKKLLIKVEGHGREEQVGDIDISRTIGWFTSFYPFVITLEGETDKIEQLRQVKEALITIPNNGIGYGVFKHMAECTLKTIKPSIEFNYLGDFGDHVGSRENSIFQIGTEYFGASTDKSNRNESLLNVTGIMSSGELKLSIGYSTSVYHEVTIEKLIASYQKNLVDLIDIIVKKNEKSKIVSYGDQLELSENQLHNVKNIRGHGRFGPIVVPDYLQASFEANLRRFLALFPVLRTKFEYGDGLLLQRVIPANELKLSIKIERDSQSKTVAELESEASSYFNDPYDIYGEGELMRFYVVVNEEKGTDAFLYLAIHHSLTDMYTNNILSAQLKLYFDNGSLTTSYLTNFEFVYWQRKFLLSNAGKQQRQFWMDYLTRMPIDQLPTKLTGDSLASISQRITLRGDDYDTLIQNLKNTNLPLSALFMAVHQSIISEIAQKHRFLQLVLVDGRDQLIEGLDITSLLGVVNNALPLPLSEFNGTITKDYIFEIYSEYLNSRTYQQIPYEIIKKDFEKKTDKDIDRYVAGEFNYQIKDVSQSNTGVDEVFTELDSTDKEAINFKCIIYRDSIMIELICPKTLYTGNKNLLSIQNIIKNKLSL